MPDDFDYAQERELELMENRIREHQYRLNQMGNEPEEAVCRNCREPLPEGQHFCSQECRDDHQTRLAAERRNGKYRGG